MSVFRSALPLALAAATLAACTPTEPGNGLPVGAVEIAPTAAYMSWYQQTETCSGLRGNVENVQFYVVPGVETFDTDQGSKVGMWLKTGNRHLIVVAGNYQNHEMVVRHEMLHSLIGHSGHPSTLFSERCSLTWESWASN